MEIVLQACVHIHHMVVEERKDRYVGYRFEGIRGRPNALFESEWDGISRANNAGSLCYNPESQIQIPDRLSNNYGTVNTDIKPRSERVRLMNALIDHLGKTSYLP